jgi:N-acetylneuraminic acid mutarotase
MMHLRKILLLMLLSIIHTTSIKGQPFSWTSLSELPDKEGFAGMFAGVSNGELFCMGGANFPDKRPWEGGTKKWYSNIYKFNDSSQWVKLNDTLPFPLAYGVSISARNKIYVIGGNIDNVHTNKVFTLQWIGSAMQREDLPSLPVPLANMAGAIINNLIILAGGSSSSSGPPLKRCFGLDLDAVHKGWFELPAWPGPERSYPTCAVVDNKFYLLSGERVGVNRKNEKFRYILQDAYCFTPKKQKGKWFGSWKPIAPLPKGAAAAGNPSPVLKDGSVLISGGVDAITALHTHQPTHPGINRGIQVYNPKDDSWQIVVNSDTIPARVTLPVVYWNNQWVLISGEVKPGVRTNKVILIKE